MNGGSVQTMENRAAGGGSPAYSGGRRPVLYRRPQAVRTGDMDFHFMSGVSNAGVIDRPADVDARFADELVLPVTLLKRNRLFSAPEFSVVTEVDGVRRQSGYFGGCRSYYGQLVCAGTYTAGAERGCLSIYLYIL